MDARTPLIANPDVVLREEFDDWAVLFDPATANAVGINPIGVFIWRLLDGQHSVEAIAAAVGEAFDEVPGSAADEVRDFVAQLRERGFVGELENGARA